MQRSQVIVKWISSFIAGALFASAAIAQNQPGGPAADPCKKVRSGPIQPGKKVDFVPFNPATLKLYVDNLDKLLNAMKAATTPAQAKAFSEKFQKEILPKMEAAVKRYNASFEHGALAYYCKQETAETKQAGAMLSGIATKGAAVEAQMARIVKLYPPSEASFKRFMASHD